MDHPKRASRAEEDLAKDDIDEIFEKLLLVEPPPALIRRILSAVSDLPRPAAEDTSTQERSIENPDIPLVNKAHLPPG